MKYKYSGTNDVNTSTEKPSCGPVQVLDADSVPGHLCKFGGSYGLYFISTDGEIVRPIAVPYRPSSFGGQLTAQSLAFSKSAGNVMFAMVSGSSEFYKLTYIGDYKASVWDTDTGRYMIKPAGDAPIASNPAFCASTTQCEKIDWELAISPSLNAQITEDWPYFNSPPFTSWAAGPQFGGLSGDLLFIFKTIGAQDVGPCHVAVVNIITRKVIDVFSTFEPDTAQGWGAGCHNIAATSYPNSMASSQNIPAGNTSTRISGGPFDALVLGVWRSGVESANTALPWPIDASYDSTCPTALPAEYQAMGAVSGSDQCVKIHMRKPCNAAPHAADVTLYGVCPYNAARSLGPDLVPGNNFFDPATSPFAGPGDSEHFRPLPPITDNGDGTLTFWAHRSAARYRCCPKNSPPTSPAGMECLAENSQMDHVNGWAARMTAGSVGSCNDGNTFYWYPNGDLASKQIIDKSRAFSGHTFLGIAPGGKMFHIGGGTYNVVLDSPLDYGVYPLKPPLSVSLPQFQGLLATIAGGGVQSYVNASQFAAPDSKLIFAIDWNHLNNNSGAASNALGNTLPGTRTFTSMGGNVWRTQLINGLGTNAVNYKRQPLIGWNGQYAMADVSGPASDIAAAGFNSFCYVDKAGECMAGSTVGQVYVKSEKLYSTTTCNPGLWWANIPCVYAMHPGSGWIRQMISTRHDTSGSEHRLLSSGFRVPGATAAYTSSLFYPTGDLIITAPGGWTQSNRSTPLLLKVPRWEDTTARNNYVGGLTAKVGARTGMTHARVRFGYNTSFHCTERPSQCITDDVMKTLTAPYAFDDGSDTLTNQTCSGGCSIPVPATPGRLTYYRIETFNGTAWKNGNTRAVVP